MLDNFVKAPTVSMENTAAVFEFLNKHDNSMVKLANTKIPNNPPTILKIIPAPMLILKMQLNQYVCADAPNPPKVATAPCSISNTLTKSRYVETANRLPAIHLARKSFFLPSAEDQVSSFIPLGLSFAYTQESAKAYTTKNNGYSISYQFMKFEIPWQ